MFFFEALYYAVCQLLRADYAGVFTEIIALFIPQHGSCNVLRANCRYLDTVIPMRDSQSFRKSQSGMFGGGVGSIANLIEEAGSRGHLQKIAATPLDHSRKHRPGCIDMGHDMDFPAGLPPSIAGGGGRIRLAKAHAGIGAKQINGAIIEDLNLRPLPPEGSRGSLVTISPHQCCHS